MGTTLIGLFLCLAVLILGVALVRIVTGLSVREQLRGPAEPAPRADIATWIALAVIGIVIVVIVGWGPR